MGKKKIEVCAVIQATYKSGLYPGKSITQIAGKTVLGHIVARIKQVKRVSDIILATSDTPADDAIADEARNLGIKVFRGSQVDVLSRLCGAVEHFDGETILKVNGNYPLFDPYLASDLIEEHINGRYDFSYNEHVNGTAYGTGCDVIQKNILIKANERQLTSEQRESGLLYFYQYEKNYKINKLIYSNPRPSHKLCFDTKMDLKLLEFIFKNLKYPYIGQIVELLDNNPILAESNKYEAVQEVGLEKLYLFPEKIASIKSAKDFEPDYSYPISVELSLTNRCNFNCVWCSDKDLRARLGDDMDFGVIKKLLLDLQQNGTKGIVIEGGGEPTIHRHFDDAVNFAHDLGFGVGLITNGSISIKRNMADKLEWIRVSLDASNAEEMKALKNNDYYEKIMSNINSLCSSNATVGVGYVVTSKNISSLESLILRLSNFGVNYIQFRPVIDNPELQVYVDLAYLKRYENRRFSVNIDGMHQNVIQGNAGLHCIANSLSTVITADGGVYLCGRLNIYDWFEPMGNLNRESFKDIWHGDKRRHQTKMVSDPEFCRKNCPRCRITKFNQLFSRVNKIKTRNFI